MLSRGGNHRFVNGNAGKKLKPGTLISSKLERNKRKAQLEKLEAEAELRPDSVATAASKQKKQDTHS